MLEQMCVLELDSGGKETSEKFAVRGYWLLARILPFQSVPGSWRLNPSHRSSSPEYRRPHDLPAGSHAQPIVYDPVRSTKRHPNVLTAGMYTHAEVLGLREAQLHDLV